MPVNICILSSIGLVLHAGDWKSQVNHVAAHLGELCRTDTQFRNKFGEPQLGQVKTV